MRRIAAALLLLLAGCGGAGPPEPPPVPERPAVFRGAQAHPMWDGTDAEDRRELDVLRDAGADAVRIDVSWPGIEPRRGARDRAYLERLDGYVAAARRRGVWVLPVLLDTPCWAAREPAGCTTPYDERSKASPPRDPRDFARVAAFLAERYGDDLAALELWNEPNLDDGRFWRSEDPAGDYAQLVRAAAPAVRAAGVPVLAGSVAFADEPFLEALRDAGAFADVDGVSLHPYTGDAPAADVARQVRAARAIAGRDVWITEAGASSCERGAGWACVGRAGQAAYLEALLGLDLPGVRALLVYQLRDKDTDGVEGGFGLVRRDFTAKPALAAVRAGWR